MNSGLTFREMRMLRDLKCKANDEQVEAVIMDWTHESLERQVRYDKSLSEWMDAQEAMASAWEVQK
jgi:hypothetical protein